MPSRRNTIRTLLVIAAVALVLPIVLQGCGGHGGPCPSAEGPNYKPENPFYPVMTHNNARHYEPYYRCTHHHHYHCSPYYYW